MASRDDWTPQELVCRTRSPGLTSAAAQVAVGMVQEPPDLLTDRLCKDWAPLSCDGHHRGTGDPPEA